MFAIQPHPIKFNVMLREARETLAAGHSEKALERFEQILSLTDAHAPEYSQDALLGAVSAHEKLGAHPLADRLYQGMLRHYPGHPYLLEKAAHNALRMGNASTARKLAEQALANPLLERSAQLRLHTILCNACRVLADGDGVRFHAGKILAIDRTNPAALWNLAVTEFWGGSRQHARDLFSQLCQQHPNTPRFERAFKLASNAMHTPQAPAL